MATDGTMRIAFITHLMAKTSEGGAENQVDKTIETLHRLRPDLDLVRFNPWSDSLNDFDIIHLFAPTNFPLEAHRITSYASEQGIKIVTTPIFHPDEDYRERPGFFSMVANRVLPVIRRLMVETPFERFDPYRLISKSLRASDLVLPNSEMELEKLSQYFDINRAKMMVVPNGVDLRFKDGDETIFIKERGLRDIILFVGRIQPVKNVASLIKAFKHSGLDADLVIIGKPIDLPYYEECRSLSNDRVHFLPPLPHGSDMLASAYKAAKVVALPSYHETVGLVALEGALAGANIVITRVGGGFEYLGNEAWYVDPHNVSSITEALINAYASPRKHHLSETIQARFNWEEAGRLTAQAYDRVLR